ncbi:MAG: hypothetical protein ACJA1A_002695 [Saprospiraceae bacterium]|jgi:hypothetical protein
MSTVKSMHTYMVYALAIIFLFMGVMGYLDIKNYSYDGYSSNDFTVTKVEEGSPAAVAGMMVGDQITSIDSLDVRDTKAWSDKARRAVGETRTYIINRNGEEVTFPMTFVAQTGKDSILRRLGWTMGLMFLLLALFVFRSKKTWSSFLFAMFCLGFAGSFMGGPHIANNMLDDIADTVRFSFLLLSFAFLVDFLLHFPKKSSFVSSANASKKLYGPAIFLVLFFTVITILKIDASSGLNTFIQFAMLAFVVIYFGWALLIMVRNYRKASSEEKTNGMSLMFWGTIIGLVPILISFIVGNLMPTVSMPGEDYMFLTMALIPICFALAINKNE